jgi:hypothetical protein
MLSNTLALTIGAESTVTLTRVSEANGSSRYLLRTSEREISLDIRQNSSSRAGKKIVSYNMLLTVRYPDTVDAFGHEYTSSFTGRFEDLSDPGFSSDAQQALHVLGSTVMSNLAAGEV